MTMGLSDLYGTEDLRHNSVSFANSSTSKEFETPRQALQVVVACCPIAAVGSDEPVRGTISYFVLQMAISHRRCDIPLSTSHRFP
jgi:hypothetical protein